MKLRNICLWLVFILFFLLVREFAAIATNAQNLINDEERRAAESTKSDDGENTREKSEARKRGIYSSQEGYPGNHDPYSSLSSALPGYGHTSAATFSSPGYTYQYQPQPQPEYGPPHYPTLDYGSNLGHSSPGISYGHQTYNHEGHGGGGHSALALKSLLIPLAGIALLGAAAALSTNPVLLQLGVVNGKRRRRDVRPDAYPASPWAKPDT